MNARCDKRTDVDRRLQELLEEKFERGELTPADKEMRSQLLMKFDKVQVDCELSLQDKVREDAWRAFHGWSTREDMEESINSWIKGHPQK
ncbi:MAG TPA: hypothetical protein VHT02_00325 [Methylocella sp.]|jgi:hypothetical protein|nr:hypothetical protein [Methylocella sp.]